MKRRIAVFMGTRPEAIKMAPVVAALEAADDLDPIVVSTGQHKEMLQQVIDLFGLDVDHELAVMRPNQTLAGLTARLMERIDALLADVKPDMALVQGDTTTVLVASLACFYRRIPIGHVEAGLRTSNIWSPFPEEANRRLASPLVTLHFPPTEAAREALVREGVDERQIVVTGNTVIDALQHEAGQQRAPAVQKQVHDALAGALGDDWADVDYVLITGHRRENFGSGFEQICEAIGELADCFPDHRFIYPVHLNPAVREPVYATLGERSNIRLIAPQGYRTFVALMRHCKLVLTDSGGVQEEAPGLGKPVIVMRDTTERPEGVEAGTVRLVGADRQRIVAAVSELLTDDAAYRRMSEANNPYGDGQAAGRIVRRIRQHFAEREPAVAKAGL
ncbi:MAG: UDP-N-acetylglucosamine 2-epimerase (non-hydrolyzing) [Phycisphaeraceae bacterium]